MELRNIFNNEETTKYDGEGRNRTQNTAAIKTAVILTRLKKNETPEMKLKLPGPRGSHPSKFGSDRFDG